MPVFVPQETATLVTLAEPTVPDPFDTVQACPAGLVFTVTLYAAPLTTAVAKVNVPFALSSGHRRCYPAAPPSRTAPTRSRRP